MQRLQKKGVNFIGNLSPAQRARKDELLLLLEESKKEQKRLTKEMRDIQRQQQQEKNVYSNITAELRSLSF